jgi:hypothetical protein
MHRGIVSQHLALTPVFAQAPKRVAKKIRAEKFVIVDDNGLPQLRQVAGAGWSGKGKPAMVPPQ